MTRSPKARVPWLGTIGALVAAAAGALTVAGADAQPHWSPPLPVADRAHHAARQIDRPEQNRAPVGPVLRRPAPAPVDSQAVFVDDFAGDRLQDRRWRTCFPWAPPGGCTNPGTGELEWYVPEQVAVRDGQLQLTADARPVTGTDRRGRPKSFAYRSGLVATAGRFEFTYGYVELRVRYPLGKAIWPAVWMAAADQEHPPEIDLFEVPNDEPGVVYFVFHGTRTNEATTVTVDPSQWHTYGLLWEPGRLTWFVDGTERFTITDNVPDEPMYLLVSLAVGGRWVGWPDATTPFPSTFQVDRIEVWQRPGQQARCRKGVPGPTAAVRRGHNGSDTASGVCT